jgi:Glu-tRNA(Gln) amidotransferase subunit E-like FAD-binding protein
MVAVVASGVIGRYIYLQIPHTIEGGEMSLNEIDQTKDELNRRLVQDYHLDETSMEDILQAVKRRPNRSENNLFKRMIDKFMFDIRIKSEIQVILKHHKISRTNIRQVFGLIDEEIKLNRKIDRLMMMQNLFKNWHIAHMPFALLMLIIMIIHVIVTIIFGARWIF